MNSIVKELRCKINESTAYGLFLIAAMSSCLGGSLLVTAVTTSLSIFWSGLTAAFGAITLVFAVYCLLQSYKKSKIETRGINNDSSLQS